MKVGFLDKIGSVGTLVTAAACPVCWPLFIPLGSALGLGILQPYEGVMMTMVFPVFVAITLVGSYLAYRLHRRLYPFIITGFSVGLILAGFYVIWNRPLMYAGIIGILAGAIAGIMAKRSCSLTEGGEK